MRLIGFRKIKTRLTVWFLCLALLPLLVGLMITSLSNVRTIQEQGIQKLVAVRDLKIQLLNSWLDERIGDIRILANSAEVAALHDVLADKNRSSEDARNFDDTAALLSRYLNSYDSYNEIFIINADSGKIVFSTNKLYIGDDRSNNSYFTETLKRGDLYIKDIHRSIVTFRPSMNFAAPVYTDDGDHIFAIMVTRVDLELSLYAMLLNRTGMGATGETLLVNQEVYALNELRWQENAPLRLKIQAEPAINSSRGITGTGTSVDYRGEKIVTAFTYIPRTGWGLVAKQDQSELNAPVRTMVVNYLILFVISAALVFAISFSLATAISRPVITMSRVARQITAGDLTVRNRSKSRDELAFPGESFNNMADAVSSQISIQRREAGISAGMAVAASVRELAEGLINTLMDVSGACLGAFYLRNRSGSKFEPFITVGTDSTLPSFTVSGFEGQLGKVISGKKIVQLQHIEEDTIFKFKTVAGTAIPAEIISIPLLVDKKVEGVITLATLSRFSEDSRTILADITNGMSTALSKLQANERTNRLADELANKNIELQSQAEELRRQSEELREQNLELDVQKEQVMESNRLKSVIMKVR